MKITKLIDLIVNMDYSTKEIVVYAVLITLNIVLIGGIIWLACEEWRFKRLK